MEETDKLKLIIMSNDIPDETAKNVFINFTVGILMNWKMWLTFFKPIGQNFGFKF